MQFDIFNSEALFYLKSMSTCSIDTIIIDPPYGIDQLNSGWDIDRINESKKMARDSAVGGLPVGMKFDKQTSIKLAEFLSPIFIQLNRIVKPGGFMLVFSQARSSHRVGVSIEDAGFELRDQLIWDYGAGQGKAQGMQNFIRKNKSYSEEYKESLLEKCDQMKTPQLTPTFETIWLAQKQKAGTFLENYIKHNVGLVDLKSGNRRVAFKYNKPSVKERKAGNNHPTQKPLDLMVDLVEVFSPKGGIILDCFCGSGTTGLAAIKLNRQFIGVDFDEGFCEVSRKRLQEEVDTPRIF